MYEGIQETIRGFKPGQAYKARLAAIKETLGKSSRRGKRKRSRPSDYEDFLKESYQSWRATKKDEARSQE